MRERHRGSGGDRTVGIACPKCGSVYSDVTLTRHSDGYIYRRRECLNGHKYTTYERVSPRELVSDDAKVEDITVKQLLRLIGKDK